MAETACCRQRECCFSCCWMPPCSPAWCLAVFGSRPRRRAPCCCLKVSTVGSIGFSHSFRWLPSRGRGHLNPGPGSPTAFCRPHCGAGDRWASSSMCASRAAWHKCLISAKGGDSLPLWTCIAYCRRSDPPSIFWILCFLPGYLSLPINSLQIHNYVSLGWDPPRLVPSYFLFCSRGTLCVIIHLLCSGTCTRDLWPQVDDRLGIPDSCNNIASRSRQISRGTREPPISTILFWRP